MLSAATRQSAGAFAAHLRAQLAMLMVVPFALRRTFVADAGASLEHLAQHLLVGAGRRTASLPAASQMSEQSRQTRMHCAMSIFSAAQASAQFRHIRAQYIK